VRSVPRISLATCLLVVGPVPSTMGQSPSPAAVSSPQAVDPAGRFVLPVGGYAITFPDGWVARVLPATGTDVPVVRAEAPLLPGASGVPFCEVKASTPGDPTPTSAIDEAAAREVAWYESGTDVPVPAVVESEVIPIAVGYAVRIRTRTDDPPSDRSIYYLTDGRVVATLLCIADHGPDDHWLSLVESFSFLPAG
jgi:hypothetical protein